MGRGLVLKVSIILPTKNEEDAIGKVLEEIKTAQLYLNSAIILEPLVVDASTDKTAEIAKSYGVKVIAQRSRGKGNAFKEALQSLDGSQDMVIMADADYTYPFTYATYIAPVNNLQTIIYLLTVYGNDVVMGYRRWRDKGAMPQLNVLGNSLLSFLASVLYLYPVRDLCSGMWGFRKSALDRFKITSEGFTLEADLFTNALKTGCKIAQFPIRYRARLGKSQAKFKPVVDWLKIVWFVIRRRFS